VEHIAIDLGGRESQVCIRSAQGEIVEEARVKTTELGRYLSSRSERGRVLLETCAEAFKVASQAKAVGYDVRVVPATLVRQLGVGARGVKTDRRDARALSEASCRLELPSVHARSEQSRSRQALLGARDALIHARTQLINTVRGWMRTELIHVRTGGSKKFAERVETSLLERPEGMPAHVQRLIAVIKALNEQIAATDAEVESLASGDEVCARLMSVPGVGPVTSLRFKTVIDDVKRFASAKALESYIGVTPGENSSSEQVRRTGVTKAGSAALRHVLTQACWSMWRARPNDPLVLWARQVAGRRGSGIAITAMTRKLSGILYAMWRDTTIYDPRRAVRPQPKVAEQDAA
jgi:transposase